MPYLKIETNVEMDRQAAGKLAAKASKLAAGLLSKGEQWVQACVVPGLSFLHGGSGDPAAYVALKSIGLRAETCSAIASELCGFLEKEASIPRERVYIEFTDLPRDLFAINGATL